VLTYNVYVTQLKQVPALSARRLQMDALDAVWGNQPAKESVKQLEKNLNINLTSLHVKRQHVAVGASESGATLASFAAVLASLNKCSLGKLLQAAKPFAVYCGGLKTGRLLLLSHHCRPRQAFAEDMQATGKLLPKTMYCKQLRTP
jgi:hypothetical protein